MTFSRACFATVRRSSAIGLLGLTAATVPALAQRTQVTNTDAVRVAVVTFARADRDSALAVIVPNGIRDRLTIAFPSRFNVVIKRAIDTNLVISGFHPDMPLEAQQWRQLARVLNSRLLVEGNILPLGGDSVEIVARLSEITGALPQTASATLRTERRRVNAGTGANLANQLADTYRSFGDARECAARRQAREYPRALEAARAAIARYPNSSQAYLCWAQVLRAQNGPRDSVIALLERARDSDSLNVLAQWQIAAFAEERRDTSELIHSLRHILVADAANAEVRVSLSRLLSGRGHADSAIAVIDSSLERNPNQADLLIERSRVLVGQSRFADAGADLARAAEIDTTKLDSAYVARTIIIWQQAADTANVIRWVRTATQRFPTQANYFYQLSVLCRARGDTAGALAAIQGYLQLRPEDGRGHLVLASVYLDMGQPDSAVAHAQLAGQADSLLRNNAATVMYAVGMRRLSGAAQAANPVQEFTAAAELLGRAKDWAVATGPTAPRIAYYLGLAQLQLAIAADREAEAATGAAQAQAKCEAARRESGLIDQVEANVTAGGRANPEQANMILTQAVPAYRGRAQTFLRQARCPAQ